MEILNGFLQSLQGLFQNSGLCYLAWQNYVMILISILLLYLAIKKQYEPNEKLVKELQNHVKRTTAPYKYPRVIEFVDELPKTYSGKIKRAQIRHQDEEAVRVRDLNQPNFKKY